MKLFMILYLGGKISAVIGPIPYDIKECEVRAEDMKLDMLNTVMSNDRVSQKDKQLWATIEVKCEQHLTVPEVVD